MAILIKNKNDLNSLLKKIAQDMLLTTRDEIHEAIQKSIEDYYSEYHPSVYERTEKFLNSLVKTEIKQNGRELICEVKIDEEYLKYTYPYTKKINPSYPHHYDGRFAMGIDVVNWANRQFPDDDAPGGNHGYTIDTGREDGFWDGTLDELGEILTLLKKNLELQGLNIV